MCALGLTEGYRHPVTNDYLPPQLQGERFLRDEGDLEGTTWDEGMLRRWEERKNEGRPWEGRTKVPHPDNPLYVAAEPKKGSEKE